VAKIYQVNGASAISVVVDRRFFQGSIGFLRQVKQVCKLPILCKDFVISDYQIYEAASEGADAILLIASYMTTEKIQRYLDLLRNLKLFAVVEIHSEEDLEKVLKTDTKIIGINNRDLRTFKVDLNTTLRLKRMIPSDLLVISESGIKTRQDLVLLEQEGINAVLVGETLLKSSNIKAKLLELLGKLNNDEG
jgi:indole-3-glycerol phosphate synthase